MPSALRCNQQKGWQASIQVRTITVPMHTIADGGLCTVQPDAVVTCDLLLCAILAGSNSCGTVAGLSLLWLVRDEEGSLPFIKFLFKTGAVSYDLLKQGD